MTDSKTMAVSLRATGSKWFRTQSGLPGWLALAGLAGLATLGLQACSSEDSGLPVSGAGAGGVPSTGTSGGTSGASSGGTSAATSSGGTSSGGTSSGGTSSGGTSSGGAPGTVNTALWGSFNVSLHAANPNLNSPAYTAIVGIVYDKVNPVDTGALKVKSEAGGCQLKVPEPIFCSSCSGGVCTAEEVCTPFAKRQNLGNVRVVGIRPMDIVMEPFEPSLDYQPSSSIPNPPCDEGSSIGVQTSAFNIQSSCIAQLELEGNAAIPVRTGQPVQLRWRPPSKDVGSRVSIYLDIAHHGGKTGQIDCDVPDNGSFDIPEPLVTDLVSLGLAGFPTVIVTRYTKGKADKAPGVELVMSSQVERVVDTGVVSCGSDAECQSSGKKCQLDKTCG